MDEKDIDNLDVYEPETPEEDNSHTDDQVDETVVKRYKEQIAGSKAEAERLRNLAIEREVAHATKDATSLLELNSTDTKLANEVAKKFGYADFEDARAWIDQNLGEKMSQKETTQKEDMEKSFEEMYQRRKAQELHELSLQKAEKIIEKIGDSWLQEKATEYFDKITKGKQLTIDEAEEFAEMATLYVNKDSLKSEKYEKWLSSYASTGLSNNSKKADSEWPKTVVRNGRLVVLDSNNQE